MPRLHLRGNGSIGQCRLVVAVVAAAIACGGGDVAGPTAVTPTGRRLSVGEATVCALDGGGKVFCWGKSSAWWEYGADSATRAASPMPVAVSITPLVAISRGVGPHMCGITPALTAICWGRGGFGQLGGGVLGLVGNASTTVQGTATWSDIAVSRLSTCGVSTAGVGYCWGSNQRGEVGNSSVGIATQVTSPSAVAQNFKSIVAGWQHACGISTSGSAYCWGDNTSGQLGLGFSDPDQHLDPLLVSFTEKFEQLSLGSRSTCGITIDHRALCWGLNATGQLGDGTTTLRSTPTLVAGGLKFKSISMGSGFAGGTNVVVPITGTGQASWAHTCALTEAGAPYCWGWNGAGQLGDGSTIARLTPVAVQGNLQLTMIGLGGSSTCGMNLNAVWCWGSNLAGQLGNGLAPDSPTPVAVLSPFNKP